MPLPRNELRKGTFFKMALTLNSAPINITPNILI